MSALLTGSAVHANGSIAWTTVGGPTGGLINALALVPGAPGMMYAGANGGVFLTRDDGAHWQAVSKGLPDDPTILALAIGRDANTVFAGTHRGVYRTTDAGANWRLTDSRFADQLVLCLLVDPQNPNSIYAGTTNTVLKSENGGDTWTDVGADLKAVRVWSLAMPAGGSALFAATDSGIYVSRDRGARWQSSSDGLAEGARPESIVIASNGLFAGTTKGLFRSKDGKIWSAIGGSLNNTLPRPMVSDPRQTDRVFAVLEQGVVRSTDGGGTWALLPSLPLNAPVLTLAPGEKNSLYVGTARGVLKASEDGGNWQWLNNGLVSTSVLSVMLLPGNPGTLLAATRYGLYRSSDRGATWSEARGLNDPYVLSLATHPQDPNEIYAGTWGGSIFISKDGGASFTRLVENLANNAPISSLIVLRLANADTTIYAGTLGNGLFKSGDGGKKWDALSAELNSVTRVATLILVPPNNLYAGTERGLYRRDVANARGAWQPASPDLPVDDTRAVVIDASRPKMILVGYSSSGLYRSSDGGLQWSRVGNSTFPTRVRLQAVALSPGAPNLVYVGTDRGVYRSEDDGNTWAAANDGLPANADISALVVDPQSPENVYAGTNGNGIVRGTDLFKSAPIRNDLALVTAALLALSTLALMLLYLAWRSRSTVEAQERLWTREWLQWEPAIADALRTTGEASENTLGKLPRRHLTRALQRYAAQHPDQALFLQTTPAALKLETFATTQKFIGLWKAAWEVVDSESAFQSVTSQMVDHLCAMLGFTRVDERAYQGMIGYVVRAPSLRLKIPPRFPIIFLPRHMIQESDLEVLRDLMGVLNMVSYFALIIDLRDTLPADARQSLKHLVRQAIHDFIVLDGADVRSLLTARDHARRLVEVILSQVDLTVVSPYVTSGPVPTNMFFGRELELKTIVRTARDTNFAIVGGRKIGKTSVLARVHQILQDTPEYVPYYLDCQATQTFEDFFQAIDTMWKIALPVATPEGLRRMVTELSAQHPTRTIVMLFDEIDGLLQYDIENGEQLFRIFRALAQELPVRFVFCGEKILTGALHNPQRVFFNFCNLLPLTYLSPDEARRVVLDPMQEMGITLETDSLADRVADLAAGHPNIVQYICQKLIERINQRRERLITRGDLEAISQSAQFAEYFVEIIWGNATPLERLITLLMLDQAGTTPGEMAETLRERELRVAPKELEAAFDGLTLYSILRRDGPRYAFAVRAFPEVLRRSHDVYGLILSCAQEIKDHNGANP